MIFFIFAASAWGAESLFHVAQNGSDANAGTQSKPFATLAAARDAARARKPARIVVHGGRYFLNAPLDLVAADSGLVIEAAPRETPVLVGRLYPSAIAVSIDGQRNRFAESEIHDTTYSALIASGNGHLIEGNLIDRAMNELHDGAGIYITYCNR